MQDKYQKIMAKSDSEIMEKRLPNFIKIRLKFDTHDFSDFVKRLTYFCRFKTFGRVEIMEKSM